MRRLLACGLVALACGAPSGTGTLTTTSPVPASPLADAASAILFRADLASALPADDPEAKCVGSVRIAIDTTRRPPLQLLTARFEINVAGCAPDTVIVGGHVHAGANGSGPLKVDAALDRSALTNGAGSVTTTNAGVNPRAVEDLLADPEGHLFDLHTTRHPAGGFTGRVRKG